MAVELYLTLDDQTTIEAARSDPIVFVRGLDLAIIDEVQRVPELMLAIKKAVDDDYRPGRFLLTGSANVMTLPRVADSLAGRMETIKLLPLSRAEVLSCRPAFLDSVFGADLPKPKNIIVGKPLVDLTLVGGFPEAMRRRDGRRRLDWGRSYVGSVLTRDLRDIADVEKLTELPRFVRLLAEHAGHLVNYSDFGKGIGVNYKTAQRYIGLLKQIFLIASLPPWYTNVIKRLVKTPKLHFLDSGLFATNRGLTVERLTHNRSAFGALLETFVFAEIMKLTTWSELQLTLYHFRDQEKNEVDLVLERDDGMGGRNRNQSECDCNVGGLRRNEEVGRRLRLKIRLWPRAVRWRYDCSVRFQACCRSSFMPLELNASDVRNKDKKSSRASAIAPADNIETRCASHWSMASHNSSKYNAYFRRQRPR